MDTQPGQIERGAVVTASDGHLGTVQEVIVRPETGELAYLVVGRGLLDPPLHVPADLIAAMPHPHEVRLRVTRDEASERGATWSPAPGLATAQGQEMRIPIVEERLVPGTRPVDLGELRIHTRVEEEEQAVRQLVTRDDLEIKRVPLNQPLTAPAQRRSEGDWLIIPIMREVLVVRTQLMLEAEVHIRTRQVTEEQEVREVVRRTEIEMEDATVEGVRGLEEGGEVGNGPGRA